MRTLVFILFALLSANSFAQTLPVGLFLTLEDFKNDFAIPPALIETEVNKKSREFYFELFKREHIRIVAADTAFEVKPKDVWGYSDGKVLFMNRENFIGADGWNPNDYAEHTWAVVSELGTLSVVRYTMEMRTGGRMSTKTGKDVVFLYDMRVGKATTPTVAHVEQLLADDEELLAAFRKSQGDAEERMYIFLRRYNAKHPLKI